MVSVVTYNELYQINPVKARMKIKELYSKTHTIRQTARILSCSTSTVSKWLNRDNLVNLSKAPKNPKRKIPYYVIEVIKSERIKTNYGRKRLQRYLKDKYNVVISTNTIKYYLNKFKLSKPIKQRARYKGVSYYNHSDLLPLEHFQIDTKEILDSKTLPRDIYKSILFKKLPLYQYTAIDVKTRMKFLGYAYNNNRTNALAFMKILNMHLRYHNIKHRIYFQTDWGTEYGGPSTLTWLKLQNNFFEPMNITLLKIRKRKWTDNAYVERTHRTDDEEFYIPKIPQMSDLKDFLKMAYGYVVHFNTKRAHYGKYMDERTPFQMLKIFNPQIKETICYLPPILLDYVSSENSIISEELAEEICYNLSMKTVRDVTTTYFYNIW